jgi:curved DNA-binding protein CbpA
VSVGPLQLDLQITPQGKGLLWALWSIHAAKASGVLTVEWERFTKQVVFRSGEPVASRSNWPQEGLAQYLLKSAKIDHQSLRRELLAMQTDSERRSLSEWLVLKQLVSPSEMNEILAAHFQERVFGLVGLSHGRLSFRPPSPGVQLEAEPSQLQGPFLKLLWDAAKAQLDSGVCRAKLAQRMTQRIKAVGQFPLPLLPTELRLWNVLSREPQLVSAADEATLKILTVAAEFDALELVQESSFQLLSELKQLEAKTRQQKYHEILEVDVETISPDAIKKIYLEMIKKYHPDRLPSGAPEEARSLAEKIFARVNEAYSTLSNSAKRTEYLAQIQLEKMGGREKVEKQLQAEQMLGQAKLTLKGKNFRKAYELFSSIAKLLPEDAEVRADQIYAEMMTLIAEKKSVKDQLPQYIRQFEDCVKLKADYSGGFYYLGLSYKMDGRLEKAVAAFDKAAQLDSHLHEASSEARILRMKIDSAKKNGRKA